MMRLVGVLLVSLFSFSKAQVISQWTPFSDCSASCNFNNPVRTRTRTCTPANLCQGVSLFDTTPCNTEFACPDYRLGDWGTWSACSASCRSTQSNPVRVRVRDYCLSNSSSSYQCTADFMVNYEPCNTAACPVVKSCSNLNITFVIVLDSSSSVTDLSWSQEKGFATSFIANSELGVNPNVQVAVVNFASKAVVSSPCGALTNKSDFINFMTALPRINGGTAINDGLLKARAAYKGCQRLNVDPVVLFLTDGFENIELDYNYRVQTENLVKSEALLFVGAIGPDVNPTDINRMSHYVVNGSDVYYNRFASNFSELASIKAEEFYPLVLGKLECESQGQWTSWGAWGSCSVVCGTVGYQRRERSCINPNTLKVQEDCEVIGNLAKYDYTICSPTCRVFSEWSSWGQCSASCRLETGPPTTTRTRTCGSGLGICIGLYSETVECNTNVPCPGTLSSWGFFGACSASCQLTASVPTQSRSRTCVGATLGGNCNNAVLLDIQNCNANVYCPGTLTAWSSWGACSDVCNTVGDGPYQSRERSCTGYSTWDPAYFGCDNSVRTEQQLCNQNVPCLGTYTAWSAWSSCSASCQSSPTVFPFQTHTRTCIGDTLGGGCTGASTETQTCNIGVSCPGVLSEWGSWGACSASCQLDFISPIRTRSRSCDGASFGGNCNGQILTSSENCNVEVLCPGTLTAWSAWSACSDNCNTVGDGPYQSRERSCVGYSTWNPNYLGCVGSSRTEQQLCNQDIGCLGTYSAWSVWSACSESCQSNPSVSPYQTHTRTCQGDTLGAGCVGASFETQVCNVGVSCPGILSDWGAWAACSASCQLNLTPPTRSRTRTCTGSSFGGNCNGQTLVSTENCNVEVLCPGTLTAWSAWSACSDVCNTVGDGPYQSRERSCVGYSTWNPNYLGCVGSSRTEQQLCNQDIGCLGTYSAWSVWSACSETCQSNPSVSPYQTHTRTCQGDTLGAGCVGASFESQVCNVGVSCPGVLTAWSAFSACSQSCQIGSVVPTMRRTRSCTNPSFGGNCNGAALEEIQNCNVGTACPGQLTEWTAWSACPASCQATLNVYLKQFRSRQCVNTSFTGNCNGQSLTDEVICVKDVPCPGILQAWSSWSECSDSCRRSQSVIPSQTRTRLCLFATLGANCGGAALTDTVSCNANVGCPGVWTSWGPFTDCSASCQTNGNVVPTQSRQRFCVNNTLDGVCPSDNNLDKVQTVQCNVGVICPVRGTWGAWSDWSVCSASCDAGVIRRSRVCSAPYPPGAGDDCIGNSTQELPCKLFDCPRSCPISKRCSCSQVKQWSSVPIFNEFQGRNLSLEAIDSVLGFLGFYGEDTVSRACDACDNLLLSTLKAQIADHLNQARAARVKLELIKADLRDVINCNAVIQNNLGLWQLYDLVFERAAMLDGVIIELNSIYLRFDAALTSCQSYGWIHQTFKTILRKCT